MTDQLPTALIPDKPITAKQTYAAPLSFVGSTRRATAWVRKVGTNWWKAALAVALVLVLVPAVWLFIFTWYLVVFGLFGLFTIPFRLIRRGQRKSLHAQQQQLATMQAMMVQQQQALAQTSREEVALEPASELELPPARDPTEEAQDVRNWT